MILRFFTIVAKRKFDTEPYDCFVRIKGFFKCLAKSDKQKGIFYSKSTLLAFSYHLIAHEYDFLLKRHKKNVTAYCSRMFNNRSVTLKL